jgi:hypothetical protein
MKRNWIRKLAGGISLTSALFVFQACYGSPQDMDNDIYIHGVVKSIINGMPIQGIKVATDLQYVISDEEGKFSFFTMVSSHYVLSFEDIDSSLNGEYEEMHLGRTYSSDSIYVEVELLPL